MSTNIACQQTWGGVQEVSSDPWYEDASDEEREEYPIDQYDITASPNDFNILTIHSFIESGAIRIPGFQRNYVWDLRRASKLIESLIIGLPVPQIFLYEEGRNRFLVIDGQQRLMSIYYFIKQRFPRKEKRPELRAVFEEHGKIPDDILHDDTYFSKFNLSLPSPLPDQPNRFNRLNYSTLGEYQTALDLRTIRNVIVKQLLPKDDDSAIYEIFNRLNSGGINLTAQEIRMCLYHSGLLIMLAKVNIKRRWRELLGIAEPDLHMKDIEFLLRGYAMLTKGQDYNPSMMRFLNAFARDGLEYSRRYIFFLEELFESFLESTRELLPNAFYTTQNRFSIMLFESVFSAACDQAFKQRSMITGIIDNQSIDQLKRDEAFVSAARGKTTSKDNVKRRLNRAKEIIRVVD